MDNKLLKVLYHYRPGLDEEQAIAAIKQVFLEMKSMQDETWEAYSKPRNELRQAIRKEVEGNE